MVWWGDDGDDVFTILLKFDLDYNLAFGAKNKTTVNLSKHQQLSSIKTDGNQRYRTIMVRRSFGKPFPSAHHSGTIFFWRKRQTSDIQFTFRVCQ
jgi:hypothetical protein